MHQIPLYNATETGSTVMMSRDDSGKRRHTCSFISISAGRSDRMAWVQHTFHFALQIFGNIFAPQHLKNFVRLTRKFM